MITNSDILVLCPKGCGEYLDKHIDQTGESNESLITISWYECSQCFSTFDSEKIERNN